MPPSHPPMTWRARWRWCTLTQSFAGTRQRPTRMDCRMCLGLCQGMVSDKGCQGGQRGKRAWSAVRAQAGVKGRCVEGGVTGGQWHGQAVLSREMCMACHRCSSWRQGMVRDKGCHSGQRGIQWKAAGGLGWGAIGHVKISRSRATWSMQSILKLADASWWW